LQSNKEKIVSVVTVFADNIMVAVVGDKEHDAK